MYDFLGFSQYFLFYCDKIVDNRKGGGERETGEDMQHQAGIEPGSLQ